MKKTFIFIFVVVAVACSLYYGFLQKSEDTRTEQATVTEISGENTSKNHPESIKPDTSRDVPLSSDIKRIIDRGTLVVGLHTDDLPPCVMTDANGELSGYDIDLAKNIALALGVKIKFERKAVTFNDLFKMVAQRKCDVVISKFSLTFERAKSISYTRPYLNIKQALLVNRIKLIQNRADNNPMKYLRTSKIKVGVLENSAYVGYTKDLFPKAEIVHYKKWVDAVDDVKDGEITAAFYDDIEIVMLVRNNPDIVLYTSVYVLKDRKDPIAIGVNSNDKNLLEWLNIYLDTYEINEDVNTLIKKYPEVFSEKKKQQGGAL